MDSTSGTQQKEQCQELFYSLYWILNNRSFSPSTYVRELQNTESCDKVFNLDFLRDDFQRHIPRETLLDVSKFKETSKQSKQVDHVVSSFRTNHQYWLWKSLTWKQRAEFLLFDKSYRE